MVEAASAIITFHDGWNIFCRIRRIGVHQAGVGVEVVVGGSALAGHFRCRHFLLAAGGFVSIIAGGGRGGLCVVAEVFGRAVDVVAIGLDHSAVFTGEGAASQCVGALKRAEHWLFRVEEIVVLHKHACAGAGSDTKLAAVVIVVVPHVYAHCPHTWVA